jgi:TRAP-type mannitol/chloroaromatic compound transport system substrate-binding protein
MSRRTSFLCLLVAAVVGGSLFAGMTRLISTPEASAQRQIVWKVQSTWPAAEIFHESALKLAKKVEEMSGGQFKWEMLPAGSVVPAFDVIEAVHTGLLDGGHGVPAYWYGRNKASSLFGTGHPYGMGPDELLAWYYKGGGREMHLDLYQNVMKFNVVTWLYGPMPMQPFGWFKSKPISSVRELKGLKYRTVGLAADLYRDMGAAVTTLPGAEIVPAIERGVIDSAEFNNPTSDRILGFPEVAKVWMVRSFHQASETLELVVNKAKYDALPPHLKSVLDYAIMAENADFQWTMADRNSRDLRWMAKEKGVRLVATPGDILQAQLDAFDKLIERYSSDPVFAKIAKSQRDWASRVVPLRHVITGGVNKIAYDKYWKGEIPLECPDKNWC